MSGQVTKPFDNQTYDFDQASMLYSQSQFLKLMTDEYIKDIKSGKRRIEDFYKSLKKLNTRDARSLLYISNKLSNKSHENINYDDDDYKNLLIIQLKDWNMPIERYNFLIKFKAENILPEDYIEWFKNDLRCSLFLMSLIQKVVSNAAYKGGEELTARTTNFLKYHIAVFNYHAADFSYKETVIADGDWKVKTLLSVKATYLKGRTKNKELKWLDVSNHEQIEWAYDYLEKNKHIVLKGVFFPETIEEKYELILASLDRLSNTKSDDIGTEKNKGYSPRSYVLFSIKKAWDGQKQYESKSKTSDGIIKIYKKNQAKLDELTKKNKMTANKLINKYIEDAHKKMLSPNDQSEKQVFEHYEEYKADKKHMNI
ncbi:hypothetical protein ACTXGZ_12200, partial [Psychrobacter celer]